MWKSETSVRKACLTRIYRQICAFALEPNTDLFPFCRHYSLFSFLVCSVLRHLRLFFLLSYLVLSSPLQSSLVLPNPPQSSLSFHPHPTLVHFPFSSILWEKLAAKREIEYILYRLVLHIRLPCFLPPVAIFPFVGCVFSVCPSVYLRFFNLVRVSTCELMSRGKIAPLAPSATHSLQTQRP